MRNSSQQAVPKASASVGAVRTFGRLALGLSAGLGLCVTLLGAETPGYVKREIFLAPGGAWTPTSPTGNPKYPNSPDSVTYIDSWVSPQTAAPNVENYGGKLSGFIVPDTTADYVFFVASDDPGAFYLSTDSNPANLKLIAVETGWSNARQWQNSGGGSNLDSKRSDKYSGTQWPGGVGAPVHLVAGTKYYAEMLWKEGGGGDNGCVTMLKASDVVNATAEDPTGGVPAQDDPSTLTGPLIRVDAPTALGFLKQPVSQTILENRPVTFSVTAVTPPGDPPQDPTLVVPDITYQWRKNGQDIPIADDDGDGFPDPGSAGTATYTIPLVATSDNNAKFTCKITTPGGLTAISAEAILTVPDDSEAPTIANVTGSLNHKSATVTFSEAVDVSTATYSLSGGLTVGTVTVQSPTKVFLETSQQGEGTEYTITVNNVKDLAGNPMTANTETFVGWVFKEGLVQYGTWQNQSGGFSTWTDDPPVRDLPPTTLGFKNLYEANTADEYDNYFGQLVGYFIPPVTGDYVFLMSSDDHGETYLSTDADPANKKKIAEESGWSNRRIWLSDGVNDNTGSRGSEGAWVNRSDQYGGTEWPDGNTIHLIAGNRYYLEVLFKEGGGGDNGGATYKLASAADPANGTPSALTGNVVGTYVDPRTLPPLITQRPVGKHFAKGETVSLSVVAESASPVTYQWYQNKRAIAGATSSTLTIANADVKAVGDYYVDVTSKNGTVSSFPDDDVRLLMNGAFVIELEDFNYGSGQTVAAASTMPLAPNLYQGKDGIPGIDFRLANQSTTDAAANGNSLRNGWINSGTTVDFPTTSADLLGNVDVTGNDGDRDRGDFTIASNYKVGWNGSGEWYNYTRNFPAGNYNVLLGTSADGRAVDLFNDTLELVTGDPTKVNAATTVIGSLVGNGTGAWSSNDLLPYRNSDGSFAQVALGTGSTLRVRNSGSNDHDLDYLLLYPVGTITVPTLSYSTVGGVTTITYTGTLQSLDTLNSTPWTDVQGAVSPYQIPASTVQKYFRSRD